MLPLTTFYRSGAHRSDVYKWDAFVTSWRFYNRAWQPQHHDRLSETSGTLWIHRGALTNQRCSLATGCGINSRSRTSHDRTLPASNLSAAPVMHGCIPARGGGGGGGGGCSSGWLVLNSVQIRHCRSLAQYIRTRPTHHGISGGSFLALERVITLVMVGTGCVLTGLLLLVNWGNPGWWRHGIVCSLPHSSPFSKKHPTQRDQQFQIFPAHFLPPPTKIASDHTKFAYSPVREPLYK